MSLNPEQMSSSDKTKTSMPMPVYVAPHLLSLADNQSAQVDLLPRFYSPIPVSIAPYPYQAALSSAQAAQVGSLSNTQASTSVSMGFPQWSSASSLPLLSVQNHMSVNAGSQLLASKKRHAQTLTPAKIQNSLTINQGSQQLSLTNKSSSQIGPQLKVQMEAFESVRSKLRESLAALLIMVPDKQSKSPVAGKNSPEGAESSTWAESTTPDAAVKLASTTSNPSACRNSLEALGSDEQNIKCNESQDVPSDAGSNRNASDQREERHDVQLHRTTHASLEIENPFSTNLIVNDELLQGHGLCWASEVDAGNSEPIMRQNLKRPKLSHEEITESPKSLNEEVTGDSKETSLQKAENLATKIEAELFKLFGGVNKKYKEKGRSLLFNLKDRNNPELRERVLSGDIAPERLCSMTAEELASKELSQWRLAKAEELAQMVVLPDSDVDIRRLVKKNHKGEFQVVEIEQDDNISVEVAVGESVLSHVPSKANGVQAQPKSNESEVRSMPHEAKASEGLPLAEKGVSGDQNASGNLDTLLNEKADFMQELMVDRSKETEFLPPIVSLDEFMQASDSEPPFDNLSMGTNLSEKNSDNSEPEMDPESDSSESKSDPALDNLTSKLESSEDLSGSKLSQSEIDSKGPEKIAMGNSSKVDVISRLDNESSSVHAESGTSHLDIRSGVEHIWEGLLQLNISALSTVIGLFRSGEKASTQAWPSFLEIKGRVRLDAFEKFLQELPLSRSRAIMIAHFCWKEGSHESGRLNMMEIANSYIADQRVGFAEPAPGMELYFCPPHPKTTEMLERNLPKDHTETVCSIVYGLIGVVVWRRPHVTSKSPRLSSHHKHGVSTKKQFSSRRQQQNVINSSSKSFTCPKPLPGDELIDDVPPGFGPGNARDEDDLPEFDFNRNPRQKGVVCMDNPHAPSLLPPLACPAGQMRELIQRYGKGDNAKKSGIGIQPWNDNDDDIPEWQPNQINQRQQLQQQHQLLPPPPPPPLLLPPLLQPHSSNNQQQQPALVNQNLVPGQQQLQQPALVSQNLVPGQQQPALVSQNLVSGPPPQQMQHLQMMMQLGIPVPMPQHHPQMGFMQGQYQYGVNVNHGWPQGVPSFPLAGDCANITLNGGGQLMQPCHLNFSGQYHGVPALGAVPLQNGMMGWRPDVPKNNGV